MVRRCVTKLNVKLSAADLPINAGTDTRFESRILKTTCLESDQAQKKKSTSKAKSVAELVVWQRVQISIQARNKLMIKLASGFGRKLCLGDQGMLMAHGL